MKLSPGFRQFGWLLGLLLALPPAVAADADPPVEGRDYVLIADGSPWQPLAEGEVEVVEIFSYACHICDELHSRVEAWRRTLPGHVRFTYLPVVYRAQDPFATGFFAAEALGELPRVHGATFDAVHRNGSLARNASTGEIARHYGELGVDRERLERAMTADETRQKLNAAHEFLLRSGAQGTPTVIINGRYRVQARSLQDLLRISDQLIAKLRAESR